MLFLLKKLFGTANDRIIKHLRKEIIAVNNLEDGIAKLNDNALQSKTIEFKEKLSNGTSLETITYEAFAVVREAAKRVMQQRHFDEQLIGGLILHRGSITEMKTGEGKTLVATLPAYLNALTGKGVHVVTVNDYLAKRDSEWMGRIYRFLGLSVGCIVSNMDDNKRREAYNSDITYATNNELGFDFLRDNMKFSFSERVQRPFNYAIIDEVDSILIDEARTPLIISGPVDDKSELYVVIDKIIRSICKEDYEKDEKIRSVHLNENGTNKVEKLLTEVGLMKSNTSLYDFENMYLVHYISQGLRAHVLFNKNVDYLVKDRKVLIIDEFTGRIMEGRRYSEGLHQALEAKEYVPIQNENQTLASITFQNYFRMYPKLGGMTGTAMTEAPELKDIYNLDVISVPTNKKVTRKDFDDEIYGTKQEKHDAILTLIKNSYGKGQPVLVGTISIEKSEELSALLKTHNLPHNVLNAKYHEHEAFIIAQAGRYKAITIATNMAGRGTDIMLGGNSEMMIQQIDATNLTEQQYEKSSQEIERKVLEEKNEVIKAGGLYVLGTERHESRRIDNQLRGRSGRQGDPGSTKFFLSLEDDLMRIFASDKISGLLRTMGLKNGEAIHHPMISRALEKAQQKVEAHNYEIRKNLLKFDNVMNEQRKIIYDQRNDIISALALEDTFLEITHEWISATVSKFVPAGSFREDWDLGTLTKEIQRILNIDVNIKQILENEVTEPEIIEMISSDTKKLFESKVKKFGQDIMNEATKYILITSLDHTWKDHLHNLDHLRQGISLRAYGQKDPLNEYKKEAFVLFEQMLFLWKELFITRISHMNIDTNRNTESVSLKSKKLEGKMYETREDPAFSKYNSGFSVETTLKPVKSHIPPEERDPNDQSSWGKVNRNELCPCGSRKKYKHCHGNL